MFSFIHSFIHSLVLAHLAVFFFHSKVEVLFLTEVLCQHSTLFL